MCLSAKSVPRQQLLNTVVTQTMPQQTPDQIVNRLTLINMPYVLIFVIWESNLNVDLKINTSHLRSGITINLRHQVFAKVCTFFRAGLAMASIPRPCSLLSITMTTQRLNTLMHQCTQTNLSCHNRPLCHNRIQNHVNRFRKNNISSCVLLSKAKGVRLCLGLWCKPRMLHMISYVSQMVKFCC